MWNLNPRFHAALALVGAAGAAALALTGNGSWAFWTAVGAAAAGVRAISDWRGQSDPDAHYERQVRLQIGGLIVVSALFALAGLAILVGLWDVRGKDDAFEGTLGILAGGMGAWAVVHIRRQEAQRSPTGDE